MKTLESAGLVTGNNKEIIEFGLDKIRDTFASWIFAVVCAWVMGDFFVGVLFEGSYMLLRSFTGGYHAKTKRKCLILTYISTLVCMIVVFVMPLCNLLYKICLILFNIIIYFTAPIQSKNKPLNLIEQKMYRKISYVVSLAESALCIFFSWNGLCLYLKTIFVSLLITVVGIIGAFMFNSNNS